jgi:hypothetical protein
MAELDARLAEVEMERRMSELETEAEWRDFVRQLEADFGLPEATVQHSVAASSTEGEPPPSQAAQLRQTVRSYVDGRTAALAARAERLLGRRKPRQPKIVYWWERIVPWLKVISTLILVGSLSVYVFSSKGDLGGRLGAIFELACAMPTAFILFISALWMERRAAQEREEARGGGRLLSLARGDREQIDRLVRRQLAEELAAVKRTLQDTRDQVYREGDRDGAVRIKQVEERADRLRRAVEAKIRGQAVYLTEARVSHDALERMLDYDEQLLAMAADLGDRVAELREAVLADESMGDEVRGLDSDLSTLDHQFQARARFIQTPVRGVEEEN